MDNDNTATLVKREVWLLNKCSLCGYLPLVRSERGGYGETWHYHGPIDTDTQKED